MSETGREIKLLIVDDNQELCDILSNYFELIDDVTLCGTAHNGEEALRDIWRLQPDVVLLDIIMPQLDGISVLERLRRESPPHMPRVIVASAIGQENITSQALALGAHYYMIKPYQLPELLNRVKLVAREREQRECEVDLPLSVRIAKMLIEEGMPTNVVGYQYCTQAIEILLQEDRHCLLGKDVYTVVAERYKTTSPCVESAIRTAAGLMVGKGKKQASNSKFLTMMTEQFRQRAIAQGFGGVRG